MKSSIRLGRVAGIDPGIHYTWLFAFALIAVVGPGAGGPHARLMEEVEP